jgi:hypothetical protein
MRTPYPVLEDTGPDDQPNGDGGGPGDPVDTQGTQDDEEHAPPRPVDRFRRTAAGSVVAAGLLGLRDAIEGRPEREEVAIVNETPSPQVDPGFRLELDEESGTVTVVLPEPPPDEDFQR